MIVHAILRSRSSLIRLGSSSEERNPGVCRKLRRTRPAQLRPLAVRPTRTLRHTTGGHRRRSLVAKFLDPASGVTGELIAADGSST